MKKDKSIDLLCLVVFSSSCISKTKDPLICSNVKQCCGSSGQGWKHNLLERYREKLIHQQRKWVKRESRRINMFSKMYSCFSSVELNSASCAFWTSGCRTSKCVGSCAVDGAASPFRRTETWENKKRRYLPLFKFLHLCTNWNVHKNSWMEPHLRWPRKVSSDRYFSYKPVVTGFSNNVDMWKLKSLGMCVWDILQSK